MKEPEYSCPYLDSAIDELEKARKIHDELRKWGHYHKEQSEQWEEECDKIKEEYKEYQSQSEYEIRDLKKQIEDLELELQNKDNEILKLT